MYAEKRGSYLAAGKGTRIHSDRPKVLQTLLGEPMLAYVQQALRAVFGAQIWTVVGHRSEMVEAAFPDARLIFQSEQLGTGHALMQALPRFPRQVAASSLWSTAMRRCSPRN